MADGCTAKLECDPLFHVVKNRGCTFDRSNVRKTLTDLIKRAADRNATRSVKPGGGRSDQVDGHPVRRLSVNHPVADRVDNERLGSARRSHPLPYVPALRHPHINPIRLGEFFQFLPAFWT